MSELVSKVCSSCGHELPASEQYFHRDQSQPDGFKNFCKLCRKAEQVLEPAKPQHHTQLMQRMQEQILRNLDLMGTASGSDVPHVQELYEAMMNAIGGPECLAQLLLADVLHKDPGHVTRIKTWQSLFSLSLQVSKMGVARKPRELLTDEEIQREIDELTRDRPREQLLKLTDGESESAA